MARLLNVAVDPYGYVLWWRVGVIFLQTARANLMYGCSDKVRHLTADVAISCQRSKFINALHFVKQWVIDQSRIRPSLRTQPGVKAIYSVLAATSFNCFDQKGENLRVRGLSHIGFVGGFQFRQNTYCSICLLVHYTTSKCHATLSMLSGPFHPTPDRPDQHDHGKRLMNI